MVQEGSGLGNSLEQAADLHPGGLAFQRSCDIIDIRRSLGCCMKGLSGGRFVDAMVRSVGRSFVEMFPDFERTRWNVEILKS